MPESGQTIDYGKKIMGWKVPEYDKHERSKNWYKIAIIVFVILIIFSFFSIQFSPSFKINFSPNFLFTAILVIGALVIIIHDGQEPLQVNFIITDEGVIVGKKFFPYDSIKDFSIVYKPKEKIKNLYFEFKNVVKPRLSIPLLNNNPLPIRENLLKYLPEDLERLDQPLSEALAKMFKL